jgi:protein-S-isoprenylcysteine O-methyltransferase Ste14
VSALGKGFPENERGPAIIMKLRQILRFLLWCVLWGAILLFSAGTARWLSAWIYIILNSVIGLLSGQLLHRNAPDVAVERARALFQKDQTPSDKVVLSIMMLTNAFLMIAVGMDKRLGWSNVPVEAQIAGAVFICISAYTTYRVALENRFAASVAKIQRDRGHKVVDTGPYQYIRHPMYAGHIFRIIGTPLLLGSWWGLCPAGVSIILLVVRILLEERMLGTGLDGYNSYVERVPYRLIPLIW